MEIPKNIAGLMLSAILSDTLIFKSPTCTNEDILAANRLSGIAGIDIKELGYAMFEAGSDFKNKTAEEIFYQDFKVFHSEDITFGVSQVSAVSISQLSSVKEELKSVMSTVLGEKKLDMVYLLLTDIINQSSELLFYGKNAKETAVNAFNNTHLKDESIELEGVVSRKKQFIPAIMTALMTM